MPTPRQVFRFKVLLLQTKPPIWRRIEIGASATFWDLHCAIQDAMGWLDCHLHQFEATGLTGEPIRIGLPDEDDPDDPTLPGWKVKLSKVLSRPGQKITYLYDFGDGWEHSVVLEAINPGVRGTSYPVCLAGARRCPPEDCGGSWGYEHLLEVLANPRHKEHRSMLEWLGGPIDPEAFDPSSVVFSDAKERLRGSWG